MTPCTAFQEVFMKSVIIAGVSAVALTLGGCGMFGDHSQRTSQAGYSAPSASTAAPAQTSSTQGSAYGSTGSSYSSPSSTARGSSEYTSGERSTARSGS